MSNQAAYRSIDKALRPADNLDREVTGKLKAPAAVVATTTTTNERTVFSHVFAPMEVFSLRYTVMQRHPQQQGSALLEQAGSITQPQLQGLVFSTGHRTQLATAAIASQSKTLATAVTENNANGIAGSNVSR